MGRALADSGCTVSERPLDRAVRSHDASHYLLRPQAVATAWNAGQVAAVMGACKRLGVPLTFRAGGTSLSGQALSDGVLVDTRTGFNAVEVLDGGERVRVQPGVTVRMANARLAPHRRKIGPDPASEIACTLGGVIANNSAGMQCGTAFNSYATVESMVVVLPSGTIVDTALPDADRRLASDEPDLHEGLQRLRDRVRADASSVATVRRLFSIKNTMGYGLNAFLDADEPADIVMKLMIGSEGTLGFIASAVLRTIDVLPHAATGLLVLPDVHAASELVPEVLATGVATAELLDAASLRVAGADPAAPEAIRRLEVADHAALLIEFQASTPAALQDLQSTASQQLAALPLTQPLVLTTDAAERAKLWRTRKGLYSAVAGARPSGANALLEDVAVPVDRLGALSSGLIRLFDVHDYDDSVIFGHARDGNLHFMLNERFDEARRLDRYQAFTEEMVDLVLGLDGTLKAEHGTGRIMAPFVERQYGAELTSVMREVKALFDPAGVLNPGTLLTDDPRSYLRDLKTAPRVEPEVDRCVECGFCEPVCPSRSLTVTPRQRIVSRRELAAADARGETAWAAAIRDDMGYDVVDTCAADGMCATACPVHIDTGELVRRLRAADESRLQGRAWDSAAKHWRLVTRSASIGLTAASRAPRSAAGLSRALRKVIDPENLPEYRRGLGPGGRERADVAAADASVVWFASCVGTMFDGGAGKAFLALCDSAGVSVRTPAGMADLCCGTPWKSKGHVGGQRRMRAIVAPALARTTDGGRLPVVVEASSCAEGLGPLVEGAGFRVVDALDFVAETVLPRLTLTHRLDRVVVHPTCSTTSLGSTESLLRLASAAAIDVVVPTTWGCCAFAGDRGLLHPELTASATRPEAADVAALGPVDAYVSSNRTCEIGMSRATGQDYRHVFEVLAAALPADS